MSLPKMMTIVRWIRKLPQVALFVLVGGGAATVHFLCVILLFELFGIAVLIANIFAFLVAFCFSFLGQHFLTFAQSNQAFFSALTRYFLIALLSFIANELLLLVALQYFDLSYLIALPVIVLLVAVGTFLVSKRWAFQLTS